MIQIIFDYEDRETLEVIAEDFGVPAIAIPEMNDTYLTLIEPKRVTAFEDALKQPPLRFEMIGSYNMDGSQYIWTENVSRNHSINKYKNKLKDIVEYDEEGNEVSRRRPTETEAKQTQVNLILGHPKRTL